MTINYTVFQPGGNDTALVVGLVPNAEQRKGINAAIMKQHPNVEQVGFVNLHPDQAELMMAGGEFCGNATRSTAWQILQGKPGEISIKVSGVSNELLAGVDEQGNAWAQMPIYADPKKVTFLPDGKTVVAMEGITHVVVEDTFPKASSDELKLIALDILKELELTKSVPAAGVMFLTPSTTGIKMRPVVWVRDIETLFYETACGSGTTAVGLLEALKQKSSINLPITQPTGMAITIKVDWDEDKFKKAVISGPIKKLTDIEELNI